MLAIYMLEADYATSGFTLPRIDLDRIAESLSGDAARLRGARFLITGGTGFFGAWLVEGLLYAAERHGFSIELDLTSRTLAAFAMRMPHIAALNAVRLIEGDVRNLDLADSAYDYVIHAAAESGGAQKSKSRLHMVETIIDGSRNLLRIADNSGAKAMLFVSSGAVYGRRPPLDRADIDEDYPGGPLLTDPDIDHDEAKRMAEALCGVYVVEHNLPVKIARCFAFVGPYLPLDAHFAAGNFIRDALAGRQILVQGDGTAVRTYLYAADLAVWLIRILLDGEAGRPYNVAGSEPITTLELAQLTASCVKPAVPVKVLGEAGLAASRIVASTLRASAELGLRQNVEVHEAMKRTIDWHRSRATV
jgi:nucleoside-diphosphate-sugar epimerase